ncbi:FAD:protein FMN transferase [Parapedobacter sp. DT-150]|uniref:FAD:protein FMN transferase n=1 Tax=Parapedobacter sp. DT-150 TaxID=3396162 RepID=UPI003F1C2673
MAIGKRWIGLLWVTGMMIGAESVDTGLTQYSIKGYAQGTDYSITYYATDNKVSKVAVDSLLSAIDSSMSLYKPYSLINKINAGGRGRYEVDEHFRKVLAKSETIYRDSKGIFDITVAPLVQLWGFGAKPISHFPDSTEVRGALACVGMDKIRLRGRRLTKKEPCVHLDVNGVAQGYTVDALADYLDRKKITHYLVELGGELRVKGPKPDGTPMRIGIERPATQRDGREATVINDVMEVRKGAVTTAGNYRQFLQDGERRVSHHIDPKSGYPFDTGIISATIYAEDAMTADGYDNVIMAMKADEAITFVNRHNDMEVFVIYRNERGEVRDTMSSGFAKLITTQ